MAVTYAAAVKTARMQATADRYDSGSLEILTAADALLATFALGDQVAAVSGDTWTLNLTASTVSASGTGTAAKAQIKTSGATAEITGLTVGTSGSDINFDSVSFTSGQDVTLSSATLQHAA